MWVNSNPPPDLFPQRWSGVDITKCEQHLYGHLVLWIVAGGARRMSGHQDYHHTQMACFNLPTTSQPRMATMVLGPGNLPELTRSARLYNERPVGQRRLPRRPRMGVTYPTTFPRRGRPDGATGSTAILEHTLALPWRLRNTRNTPTAVGPVCDYLAIRAPSCSRHYTLGPGPPTSLRLAVTVTNDSRRVLPLAEFPYRRGAGSRLTPAAGLESWPFSECSPGSVIHLQKATFSPMRPRAGSY